MSRIEAVIFDIGNVLVEWQPERFYDGAIGPERRARLFAEVDLDGMNARVDLGGDFTATIYGMAERHPEWRDEIRLWHDAWIELFRPEIPHSIALLRALRARGVPVFALSNFGIASFGIALGHYPFLNSFDRHYISGHMGVIKPDPRIYAMAEADCGVAPEALLFADDRADNIRAAEARGWQGHVFDGPEGWAARLVAEGLLTEAEAAA